MGELKDSYKGYDLWLYAAGEKNPQKVWAAVSKGKRIEIHEYRKTKAAIKKLITETLNQPPRLVETYLDVEIVLNPKTSKYEANIGNRTKKLDNIDKLKKWIEKQKKKD